MPGPKRRQRRPSQLKFAPFARRDILEEERASELESGRFCSGAKQKWQLKLKLKLKLAWAQR